MRVKLRLTALALALGTGGLRAQEVQVPVDQAGRIQVITAELARRVGLFTEVDNLREARLFQLPDSSFVLEITSGRGDALRRDRRPLSSWGWATTAGPRPRPSIPTTTRRRWRSTC